MLQYTSTSSQNHICALIIIVMLFLFLAAYSDFVLAYNYSHSKDIPTSAEIKSQLDEFNKKKELSAQDKLIQQDLINTLETINKIDKVKYDITKLSNKVPKYQYAEKMRKATKELKALNYHDNDDETRTILDKLSLRQLELRVTQLLEDLQTEQSALSKYNSQLVSLQMQPDIVQNYIYAASQQLQHIRKQLNRTGIGVSENGELRPSEQTSLIAKQVLLNIQIEQQRKSLEGNTVLQDTLQKQRDSVTANINKLEHQLKLLQEAVNSKRSMLTYKTADELVSQDEQSLIKDNKLVKHELEINHYLSQRLIKATESWNMLFQKNIKIKNLLDRSLQAERNIKEQVAVLKGSILLSRILYQQQQTIPSADELEEMTNQIADLRLEQFDINQQRDTLFQSDAFIAKLEDTSEVSNEVHEALMQVIEMRRDLLDKLNKQLGNQIMMAINLQINQQQLMSVSNSLQDILTQQIFWVNSNKPMDWGWIKAFPNHFKDQIKDIKITGNWKKVGVAIASIAASLPLLLIAGFIHLRLNFNWLRKYKAKLAQEVGQLRKDSQLHTPKALIIDLIYGVPVCIIIFSIDLILLTMQLNISDLLLVLSKKLVLFWLVFSLCWKVLEKDGVAVLHFSIPEQLTSHWRRQFLRISLALLPLHFWSVMAELSPLHLMDDVIGQFLILLNLLLIAVLMWPMCRDSWRDKYSNSIRIITMTILSIVPVALMVLTATGYFYTTLRLSARCIETVYLVIVCNLLWHTVLRGLSVAARRIAYRRAIARSQSIVMVKDGVEGAEQQEEPSIALEQVNQQTLRITKLVMVALFSVIFWAIWSDLIPVFAYLDSITLWHYHDNGTQAGAGKNVTMGSLLFAIVASMVVLALIRNLPGLLEVLVLSRLNMRQGASYAITTILNYVIIAVGAMTVFGSLGVSWNKLQWLAAALSVGLGFGLQEIFGNFVSGIIILFERPVRIGDTVTIGTFSGTVSKICIRATTITDFDRKEVIIPNKAFVTERLINWSLSDTITRVVIRVGVAYGSDLSKVKKILLQAAMEHPKVMHDPAPAVFFTAFGQSSLDHELRLYVRELRDRSNTVDELNRTIDRLCRENYINIAFNQLEVHLHNNT